MWRIFLESVEVREGRKVRRHVIWGRGWRRELVAKGSGKSSCALRYHFIVIRFCLRLKLISMWALWCQFLRNFDVDVGTGARAQAVKIRPR